MLEILKNVIDLVMQVINQLFYIEIEITSDFHAPLGFLIITAMFICILIAWVLHALGIDFGGDD